MSVQRYIKKFFQDKHGKVVIWQTPNLPLILWFVFMLATRVAHGQTRTIFVVISSASLLIWAFLEIILGASYFRRVLGLVVLIAVTISRF